MSYQIAVGDPVVTFDTLEFEKQIATACKNNAITTDAQFQAALTGMAPGSALEAACVRALMRSTKLVP